MVLQSPANPEPQTLNQAKVHFPEDRMARKDLAASEPEILS